MTDLARLETDTAVDEGVKSKPYKDSRGLYTVGAGRCLETDPLTGVEWKMLLDCGYATFTISPAGANILESQQLATITAVLARDYDFWPRLNDARQNALAEIAFQIGVAGELAFHDMIAAIRVALVTGEWAPVNVAGLDSAWAKETPARAEIVLTQLCTGVFASGR